MIIAHRGASFDAPENTMAAFKLAWEQGADAVEGDFHLTRDGHIVCIHDKDTARVAGTNRIVADSALDDLQSLDVGVLRGEQFRGERIPTLAEVLGSVPEGRQVFIEIKAGCEIVAPLVAQVRESKLEPDQVVVMCFDDEVVALVKAEAPRLNVGWLCSFRQKKHSDRVVPDLQTVLKTLENTGADFVASSRNIPDATRSEIQRRGYPWRVWTVNDPVEARAAVSHGAVSIITDRPAFIRKALGGNAK